MAKVKGLGRGLEALLGANDETAAGETLAVLPVEALQPGRYQPRTRMDPEALAELAGSIKAQVGHACLEKTTRPSGLSIAKASAGEMISRDSLLHHPPPPYPSP